MKNKHTRTKNILIFLASLSVIFGSNITSSYFQLPAIAQTQKNSKAEAVKLRIQGEKQIQAGQYALGTQTLERAMRIYQGIGDKENADKIRKILRVVYSSQGAYEKLEQQYSESGETLFPKTEISPNITEKTISLGLLQMRKKNYAQARIYFEQVLSQAKSIWNNSLLAVQYQNIGLKYIGKSYLYEQKYSKALDILIQADKITEGNYKVTREDFNLPFLINQHKKEWYRYYVNKIKYRLSILLLTGETYLQQGNPKQALKYFQKVSATATEYKKALPEGVPIFWEDTSLHISRAYYNLGDYEQAIIYANKALRQEKTLKNTKDLLSSFYFPIGNIKEGHSHVMIGIALNKLGKLKEAEKYIEQAVKIFEAIRQKSILQTDINEVLKLFENQVRATSLLQKNLLFQNKSEAALSMSEWGRSRLLLEASTIPKGLSSNEKYDAIIGSLFNEAIDLFLYYKYPNVPANFRQSIKDKFIVSKKEECLASGKEENCWKVFLKNNSSSFNKKFITENTLGVNLFYRSIVKPKIKPPNVEQLKQIARSQQKTIVEYSIVSETTFFHNNATSIELLEKMINSSSSIDLSNRSPSVIDFLRGYERNNYPILSAIASSAKAFDHTFIPWNIFPGKEQKLVIWVIKPTGEIQTRQIDLKNKNINFKDLISSTRKTIENARTPAIRPKTDNRVELKKQLKQIHQLLIDPIADLLPTDPKAKVVFVPHKQLFLVPFAVLIDSNDKYLIEKHTIITAPSIQALKVTREKQQRLPKNNKLAVVVGNPTMPTIPARNNKPPQKLSNLQYAEEEGRKIAQRLNTQFLTGNKATKATVLKQLPNARYIHLATHGLLEDYTGFGIPGAIALAPSGKDKGFLTSSEIQDLDLKAELAVLSACDTGRGDITGDGVVGLSRALIVAGVPSVVVSLWAVPDNRTAELMVEFYRNFQDRKLDKAQALRQAMLEMMKTYRDDPIKWGAFTLIGQAG